VTTKPWPPACLKKKGSLSCSVIDEKMDAIIEAITLEEKYKLLTIMLDAVYVDLLNSRSIAGILPTPTFYGLF
jgi:hypothetical protein